MFHAKVVAMPFVLTEEVASPPDSKAFTKWTIARRSDGSTVHIDYLRGLTVRELTTRRIDYIDGSRVTVGDSVGMKITWPLLVGSEFTALRKSILDPPGNCVMSDRETLIGFREIWGQRVAILDSGPRPSSWDPANTMRITKSRALDLACEELGYSIEEVSHVDGSSKLMTRAKLVSLTLGEPDKSLFEVSSTLTESRPSQFWQRLMQISGVPTDADDIRQWSQEDRVYSGR
jgi:hypothetical protein